jgi:hypothetical protein
MTNLLPITEASFFEYSRFGTFTVYSTIKMESCFGIELKNAEKNIFEFFTLT